MLRMVKLLSELYGVPYRARPHPRPGRRTDAAAPCRRGFATVATSTLIFFVPGVNLLGLAVSSVTASRMRPRHRTAFRRAFRERARLAGFPCHRSAVSRMPSMTMCRIASSLELLALQLFFICSIRLFGRMSVQFWLMYSRQAARLSDL